MMVGRSILCKRTTRQSINVGTASLLARQDNETKAWSSRLMAVKAQMVSLVGWPICDGSRYGRAMLSKGTSAKKHSIRVVAMLAALMRIGRKLGSEVWRNCVGRDQDRCK